MIKFRHFSGILLTLVVLYHSFYVFRSAVNIPFWDEWEFYVQQALPSGWNLSWIFLPHNEHTIATLKILTLLFQKFNILNYTFFVLLSWTIYVSFISFLLIFSLKTFPRKYYHYLSFYFIFLFSTILFENHSWGFQICFHLSLIFQFFAIYVSIYRGTQGKFYFLLLGLLILSSYSLSIGVPMSLSTVFFISLYEFFKEDLPFQKLVLNFMKSFFKLLIPLLISLTYWFYNFQLVHHNNQSLIKSLLNFQFWTFFVSLNGLTFGYNDKNVYWWFGLIPLGLFCFSLFATLFSGVQKHKSSFVWIIFGLTLLAALGTISLGRHSFGPSQALSSRYSEISLLLIPVICNLLFAYLDEKTSNLRPYLFVLGSLLFFGFLDDWDFRHYTDIAEQKTRGRACLEQIYQNTNPPSYFCPTIYPNPAPNQFMNAKKMGLDFSQ
jgi:hypothetical protein